MLPPATNRPQSLDGQILGFSTCNGQVRLLALRELAPHSPGRKKISGVSVNSFEPGVTRARWPLARTVKESRWLCYRAEQPRELTARTHTRRTSRTVPAFVG